MSETVSGTGVGVKERKRRVKLQLHNDLDSVCGISLLTLLFAVLLFMKHEEPFLCSI